MDDERGGGASSLRKATSKIRETLPIRLTSFIGPEAERTAVRRLLDTDRLVTLTGAGGCGKTRFALQLATDRRNRHPDGVWWVDLSTLADHALVVDAIASELELKEVPGKPLLDTPKDGLRGERPPPARQLRAPRGGLRRDRRRPPAVVPPPLDPRDQPRAPLGVEGEVAWRVPSLGLPSELNDLAGCESAQLFVDRASRAKPGFDVTDEESLSRI